jgi:single-stranded-DNA-specific exonuclease
VPTASEARFEALLRSFDSDTALPAVTPAAAFLDELYARRDEFLVRDPFASIGFEDAFNTKIVGVSFDGRQEFIAGLQPGDRLELVRQPENEKDPNAVAVFFGTLHLGFVRAPIAQRIAPNMDAGERYGAEVTGVTGGRERHRGVNIRVSRRRAQRPKSAAGGEREEASEAAVQRALIGDRTLRESQTAVLERVAGGSNTLAVLGTGRGKSLCYQLPAANRALAAGQKTLVIYPLRALANDQFESLSRKLRFTGLRILRANGAISSEERTDLTSALGDGSWDLILSTPEFVQYHGDAFEREHNRPALLVVDEAHHVHESRHRPAYAALGEFLARLDSPQVLALTATAGDGAFEAIRSALAIDAWVIDPYVRENLRVVDARQTADKNAYLRAVCDAGSRVIIYCNSRTEATKVAERLRGALKGGEVAFYHAGMAPDARLSVETFFRSGAIRVVVATSAFGEGIDLPDVRDVVLYHLNFNFTEFNQQAGRAGRDGAPARVHLLYGERDRSLNDFIIARANPSIETLRSIYRAVRGLSAEHTVRLSFDDIARTLEIDRVRSETIAAAISIFEEAGLVTTGRDDDGRFLRFREVAEKVDLTKTARFAEGMAEREAFEAFCSLALGAKGEVLEQVINRPIYPERTPLVR